MTSDLRHDALPLPHCQRESMISFGPGRSNSREDLLVAITRFRDHHVQCQNGKTLRTTGKVPTEVWEEQTLKRTAQLRPTPEPTLLDLHFSLRSTRKVHLRYVIQFDGLDYEIAPTSRKSGTVLFHPFRKLWVLERSPKLTWPPILGHFTI
jgi:hypothetical protein